MINTRVKIHDKFSLEFKIGFFNSEKSKDINKFKINTWIFVPNGLDINSYTYSKEQFYSDIKSNVRLITPIYSLTEILTEGKGPFRRLNKALDDYLAEPNEANSEVVIYHTKMFLSILKSSLRETIIRMKAEKDNQEIIEQIKQYQEYVWVISKRFREIRDCLISNSIVDTGLKEYFLYGDEYLTYMLEENTFAILRFYKHASLYKEIKLILRNILEVEAQNKAAMSYAKPSEKEEEHNSFLLIKRSLLKKFVESDLYLQRIKKADGVLAREFYYSIAAGVAMVFATVISFLATQRFGNFTMALFLALVVSYMFKDRIKEMARYYFSSKLDQKYFDWKWKVSLRNRKIGEVKEAFDFIQDNKLPEIIRRLRNKTALVEAENRVYDEKVILYRKRVSLSKKDFDKYKEYHLTGINDIIRFNLISFTKKMDNPVIPMYIPDEKSGYQTIMGKRVYSLYFILECQSEEETYYKKYRILLNRNGISDVTEIQ